MILLHFRLSFVLITLQSKLQVEDNKDLQTKISTMQVELYCLVLDPVRYSMRYFKVIDSKFSRVSGISNNYIATGVFTNLVLALLD